MENEKKLRISFLNYHVDQAHSSLILLRGAVQNNGSHGDDHKISSIQNGKGNESAGKAINWKGAIFSGSDQSVHRVVHHINLILCQRADSRE